MNDKPMNDAEPMTAGQVRARLDGLPNGRKMAIAIPVGLACQIAEEQEDEGQFVFIPIYGVDEAQLDYGDMQEFSCLSLVPCPHCGSNEHRHKHNN